MIQGGNGICLKPHHLGGDGAIAFTHAHAKELGPPSGGNGGRGGDVFVKACKNITSLHEIKESYRIDHGRPGQGMGMHGVNGGNTTLKVPVGTVIRQIDVGMVLN